ncbi:hypothetical protein CC80DRAFT_476717 [Byssothecium circinans]|uniref:Uncharacterized protein n=1 Tax=Byssothecium circinans TaxID=147558 RepID=A0A6A5TPI3_9PLEO|nr:hypothetical protein CC80DRAFT_476717 [Byssothecium circinans]
MAALDSSLTWTMDVALNRKRSRLALGEDEDENDERRPLPVPSPALSTFSDGLKRSRTQGELEELDIIRAEDAWSVDVEGILASNTIGTPEGSGLRAHDNVSNYHKGSSIIVFCVQGGMQLHYNLLCSVLPELYAMSPALQALVLCRNPATHMLSSTASFSLPLIQAVGPGYNHFVRLGLLHPLGGGEFPLDAIVVVDAKARRRLVLPFGWGAGKHAQSAAGGVVQERMMELLRNCVQTLARE